MTSSRALWRSVLHQRRLLHSSLAHKRADEHLRAGFDDARLWNSLVKGKGTATTGLFGYPGLYAPSDLQELAERVHRRAQILVRRITKANLEQLSPEHALWQTAKQFDRLSDTLCSVIDMSEAIRQVHPDRRWVQVADEAYDKLAGYMNVLNTYPPLYETLQRVAQPFVPLSSTKSTDASLFSAISIAQNLLLDFERSGIGLPEKQRQQVVKLNDAIMQLSRRFFKEDSSTAGSVSVTTDELDEGTSSTERSVFRQLLKPRLGRVSIAPGSWEAAMLYRDHPSEPLRRKMYRLAYPDKTASIRSLEEMLVTRQELARLVGKRSFGELVLTEKMAGNPENVMSFLRALAVHNKPLAAAEVDQLSQAKALQLGLPPRDPQAQIFPWDKEYLSKRYVTVHHSNTPSEDMLSPYFSVGTVVQGLSRLFTSLYGISLQIEHAEEPLWHPSVRKLAVIDENEGRIGTLYADLFHRAGKDLNAAHYTVRCARRVDDDEQEGDAAFQEELSADEQVLDMPGFESTSRKGRHQLPIIVLTCGVQPQGGSETNLMTFDDVSTVFHECGHAIHSMIGRTDFHEVSGTRCATDFVELPSVLMEFFASSPAVLRSFARHHRTDEPLPFHRLQKLMDAQNVFSRLYDNMQLTMAAVDQAFHAELPSDFSSTRTLFDVQQEFSAIPPVEGAAWQSRFTHLSGYGATYYSYLFDRAIAGQVWRQIFEADPLSRKAGERYKTAVLRHGASKNPWECVGDLLQDEAVAGGGQRGMARVGEWGVVGDGGKQA